jgi:carboxyl-terminal processing protease
LAKKTWKSPFSESLIDRKYLRGERSLYSGEISGGSLLFEIAYLRISAFPDDVNQVGLAIDKALKSLSRAKAMVVDIRDNRGGSDQGVVAISNRFADQRRLFMMSAIRLGQNRTDLANPKEWFLEPAGTMNFHCPVALLINRDTFSAGETFTLAMRVLPQVKIVGEPTAGAFSDAEDGVLPNGWQFTFSIGVWRDAKGQLWEGKGVPPDVAIKTSPADLTRDINPVLEWAIDYLKVQPCNR